jgi:hypothetical protein
MHPQPDRTDAKPGQADAAPEPGGTQPVRPLPDPIAIRLCAIPDSSPPYDAGAVGSGTGAADGSRPAEPALDRAAESGPAPRTAGAPDWPSKFAQVLAETLAGARPPAQLTPWTTERARSQIRRLGPLLTARQRPVVQRILTSRPSAGVVEMSVVVGVGPRVRGFAVRLERAQPATPPDERDRWLCTAVEAA